jgi:hypothetical protein
MKAIFRADCSRGGFISSTLAPCNDKREARFSMLNGLVLIGLLFGLATMVRLLLAH